MNPFFRTIFAACLLGLTVLSAAQVVDKNSGPNTGSLWDDSNANPILDRTARREGDLITILISESAVASYQAQSTADKQDSNAIDLNLFNNVISRLIRPWTSSDTSSQKGGGTATQNSKLTARLTAVVQKVLPNGSMMITGSRSVTVNKEVQTFVLSGVIRRDDVRSDNTVLSENIANADIRLEGKGTIHNRTRRGLLTQILDWLF